MENLKLEFINLSELEQDFVSNNFVVCFDDFREKVESYINDNVSSMRYDEHYSFQFKVPWADSDGFACYFFDSWITNSSDESVCYIKLIGFYSDY